MRKNIGEILRNPGTFVSVDCEELMPDIDYYGSAVFPDPVRLTGEVRNRAGLVTFEGTVRAKGSVPCARCLEPAEVVREIPLSLTLTEKKECADLEDYLYVEGDMLDMHEVVRDELILSLDMVTLCEPDCRGLCPKCGRNLNAGDCGCETFVPDSRLQVLAELLSRQQNESN